MIKLNNILEAEQHGCVNTLIAVDPSFVNMYNNKIGATVNTHIPNIISNNDNFFNIGDGKKISNDFIKYDDYKDVINTVIGSYYKYDYYKKNYIEKLICDKKKISVLEYDFLSDKNKNMYDKCFLFSLFKIYNKK